ncbi:lantibiotic dehydratase [Streptomyces laurentii]|uniref:lantibiotic dehydratase n=1 Tax=Streptomyces laurentii TaxID=39478 RepID=UPI0036B000EA
MDSPEITYAGYGVVRVCSQPADVIAQLSSREAARVCDELRDVRRTWQDLAPRVAEELTEVVPLLTDRDERRTVLALRRRLHRAADVPAADLDVLNLAYGTAADGTGVDGPLAPGAAALRALAERRDDLAARLEGAYEEGLNAERKVLASAALDPALRAGAQLSADGLLRNMDRYAAAVAEGTAPGKRERMTESTVLHLLTRSTLKPSPFGQLVHTRPVLLPKRATDATPVTAPGTAPGTDETNETNETAGTAERPVSVCRLPRQLVSWVERSLAGLPAFRHVAVLRRAPVVGSSKEGVVFLLRGRDGTHEPAAKERFVRVPPGAVVTAVLALAADAAVPERELRERCAALPGTDPAAAGAALDALIGQGVLARDLGVGDQHPHPLARLAALLPPDCNAGLRAAVSGLAGAESAFETAGLDRREELVARIKEYVAQVAELTGVATPPIDVARTLVYEDAVVAVPRAEAPDRWGRHLPALAPWHRLLPLFDDAAHVRAIVADVVRTHFGPGPHRLLPLFAALSSAKVQAVLTERLTDVSAPLPTRLRTLQDAVFALADPDGGADTVTVAPERAARLADDLPSWIPRWSRASWHVQHHAAPDGGLLVVNGGSIGFGRAISRFLPAYAAAGDAGFGDLVTAEIARDDDPSAPLTDLAAVLGINANVHSPLLGRHLRYPCATPEEWGGNTGVSLEDCWVVYDADTGRLLPRLGKDGPVLRLVMLNFLLNELAPRFYQFLNFFSSGSLANLAWWDRVDQRREAHAHAGAGAGAGAGSGGGAGSGTESVRHYPRVRSGSLVLARRTWKVPDTRLPDLAGATGASAFAEVRRWQESLGLPDQVFYRGFTLPDPLVPMSREEQRTWARTLARFPTSAERKPTFLDFTSVTSVTAWQRALRRCQGGLTFQECLPAVGGDEGAAGGLRERFTEEFIVETTETEEEG